MKALLFLGALVVGFVALMLQGDFGTAGIVLLVIGMIVDALFLPMVALPA